MSTSDAPKLLLLLKPWSPLSDKHSSHKNSNSVYILRLFNPSFSTALNLRFTLLISPQLAKIDSLHCTKSSKSKVPILQVSPCIAALRYPQIPLFECVSFLFIIPNSAFLLPWEFPTLASSISVIYYLIQIAPISSLVLTILFPCVPFQPRSVVAPHERTGLKSLLLKPLLEYNNIATLLPC